MKNFFLVLGGLCAATVGFIMIGAKRVQPVEGLAHQLEDAWKDQHTIV
jgi:hypothetical protein